MSTDQHELTLTDFLSERIDKDEAGAREVYREASASVSGLWDYVVIEPEAGGDRYLAVSPERVMEECEAKRLVVGEHGDSGHGTCTTCNGAGNEPAAWPCLTLRMLALPYAYHPDYREEWAV